MIITLLGLVTVALFAVLGYGRGVLSVVAFFFSLLVAGLLAEPLTDLVRPLVDGMEGIPLALKPLAAELVAGLVVLAILSFLTSWWLRRRRQRRLAANLPVLQRWERIGGVLIGALWGFGLVLLVLSGLHLLGSVEAALARATPARSAPAPEKAPAGEYHAVREQIDDSVFAPLVQQARPVEEAFTTTLADLAKVAGSPALLDKFQHHPVIARFIRDPRLRPLAQDEELARLVRARQYHALLDHPKIAAALQDQALVAELRQVEMRQILREVIDGQKQ